MADFHKFALVGTLSMGGVFLAIGLISFLPLYLINSRADQGYVQGNCTYEKGYIQGTSCETSIRKEDCWFGMVGLSAIYNVTCYLAYGPFSTQAEAKEVIDYDAGSIFGLCYYRNNGTEIVIELKYYTLDLIVFILFISIGTVIVTGGVFFYYYARRKRIQYRSLNSFNPGEIV